jgi:uncharacterized membrane protein YphA (DoxX/SURF4 family)|tara:strand:- start:1371 stop:1781 length:411 start_codon:yes stop_codon:yes gene_type:complete
MIQLFTKFNNFFSNFEALGSLFLRLAVGIAFVIYGLGKFPLPPQGLMEYFGLSPFLASLVAISEVSTGIILIISNFIKDSIGHTLTRLAGLNIVILMVCIFVIAHRDWFITKQLFTSIQTFLLVGGFYFLVKGNKI